MTGVYLGHAVEQINPRGVVTFVLVCSLSTALYQLFMYDAIAFPHLPWHVYRIRLAQLPRHGPAVSPELCVN